VFPAESSSYERGGSVNTTSGEQDAVHTRTSTELELGRQRYGRPSGALKIRAPYDYNEYATIENI